MKKAVLALFLLGIAYSHLIGNCYGDGKSQAIHQQRSNFGKGGSQVSQPAPEPVQQQTPILRRRYQRYPNYPQQPLYPNYPQQPLYPNYPQQPLYPNYPQQPLYPNSPQKPNNPYQPQRNVGYVLSFDWAPTINGMFVDVASSKAVVKIGSQIVANLQADTSNTKVRHTKLNINLQSGENSITFKGAGKVDSNGITITNVVIRRSDSNENLLVNGDFSSPDLGQKNYQYFYGGILGWSVNIAEVGKCQIYNTDWKCGQCIDLDTNNQNQSYTQTFTVDKC